MSDTTPITGNVVKNSNFASTGDWISSILSEHCAEHNVGAREAVAAVEEVKAEDGTITTEAVKAVRGKKGKTVVDAEAVKALAAENNVTVKDADDENGGYPNAGMLRMNVGNMLRAAARKRGGLFINGEWTEAPSTFETLDEPTHNRDGSKIVKAKAEPETEAEDA